MRFFLLLNSTEQTKGVPNEILTVFSRFCRFRGVFIKQLLYQKDQNFPPPPPCVVPDDEVCVLLPPEEPEESLSFGLAVRLTVE